MHKIRRCRWLFIALSVLMLVLSGCSKDEATSDIPKEEAVEEPEEEPAGTVKTEEAEPYNIVFEGSTIDGEAFSTEQFADVKLTMINVWATYCNPCLQEMPDLGAIAASYDSGEFQMIGVIADVLEGAAEEELAAARELIWETEADTYKHLLLNEEMYRNLVGATNTVPTTYFVNQEGELLGYLEGAQSRENWEKIINDLLEEE